jgi:phosphatidylserine/phosphatidylglycerophosphate/cardiolipin synthase-like enzyme
LRTRLLELLAEAQKSGQHIFGALYELDDDELVKALGALGPRAHIVLANGSIESKKGVPAAEARKLDQNKPARAALRKAKSAFPASLVDANSTPAPVKKGKSASDIWFSRTRQKVDLAALDEVLDSAKEGILFLMFQPGGSATLGTVRKLQQQKKTLYVKGVVSTLPAAAADDERAVSVEIHGATGKPRIDLDVVQPQGIRTPFASWAATVTRNEFITREGGVIGFAIVHSKLIVVDPCTHPVVVTGSHNFSASTSEKNDENFMIVRGNEELARHYAAHILSVYQHYRWLAYVNDLQGKGKSPDGFLRENDRWQDAQLKGAARRELDFWAR